MYILCGVFIRFDNYLFGDHSDKNLIRLGESWNWLEAYIFLIEDFE